MKKNIFLEILDNYKTFIILIVLIIVVSTLNSSFLSVSNLLNTLRQSSVNSIIAFGMTFVILSGGIDLSVGSILALSSAVAMYLVSTSAGSIIAIFASILIGVASGVMAGVLISKYKLQPFIVTLVMMNFLRGITLVFTNGKPITVSFNKENSFYDYVGNGRILGIPIPVIIMFVLFALSYYILYYTRMGRYVYAIGGNEEAAKLSGVRIFNVKVFIYSYCGFLSAVAGVILSARLSSAQPTAGLGYELDAIAAVVVGGTTLSGGSGFLINTLLGAFVIGILNNALNLLQVSAYYQTIVKAIVILFAVLLNSKSKD